MAPLSRAFGYGRLRLLAGLPIAWLILTGFGGPAHEGAELQKSGNYLEALDKYKEAQGENPENRVLDYNMGGTYHKLGQFDEAIKSFGRAADGGDPALTGPALFNRGVSLYRAGESAEGSGDSESARKLYSGAAESFKKLLKAAPADNDSRHNLELAMARIQQMEEREKRNQSRDDQGAEDKKESKEQKQDKEGKDNNGAEKNDKAESSRQKEDNKAQEEKNKSLQEKEPQETGQEMTQEEARQTLDAVMKDEKELKKRMRERMIPPSARPEKDW